MSVLVERVLDFLFPKYCVGCKRTGKFLCDRCYQKLHFLRLPINLNVDEPVIDGVWAMCAHEPPMTQLLYQLKYHSVEGIGAYLGKLLYYACPIPAAEVVTCVPLHRHKLQWRGFNQAEVIARTLAPRCGRVYLPLLVRTRHSRGQASGMNKKERAANTRGLYAVEPVMWQQLRTQRRIPKSVLIIDDVTTTGATLNECAQALKKNGVQIVYGLTVTHQT